MTAVVPTVTLAEIGAEAAWPVDDLVHRLNGEVCRDWAERLAVPVDVAAALRGGAT